jgi:hypothetical protein
MEGGALSIYASTVNTIRSIILCSLSGTECPWSKVSFVNWDHLVEIWISVVSFVNWDHLVEIWISVADIGGVFARSRLHDIKAT